MPTTRIDQLFYHLDHRPEQPAFELGDQTLSFGELDHRARCYAAGLTALGVDKGDRVLTILDSSTTLVEILVGHHRLGAVHVPVNTRYRRQELAHIVADAAPTVIVVGAQMAAREILSDMQLPDSVRAVVVAGDSPLDTHEMALSSVIADEPLTAQPPLDDNDLALFIYTSGTTGPSKGVEHTYRSVVAGIHGLTDLWEWSPQDCLVLALPLFHVHGLCIGIHGTLICGNRTLIQPRFSPEQVAAAIADGGTIFMGVPTMHTRLVEAMEESPALARAVAKARLVTSGSAALRPDIFTRFESLTGQTILERYGMSETLLTISNPYRGERRLGSVGLAVPGTEVRIVDESDQPVACGDVGEIQIRGPSVMRGYWGLPDKTAAEFTDEGFFRTGDVARQDTDGYIYIAGRKSVDIIKSGGYKISAREIETVIRQYPGVDDVAVVGLPDKEWGQRIVAAVIPGDDIHRDSQQWHDELAPLLSKELADFKFPKEFVSFPDGLPRNALGKIQKHRIIDQIQQNSPPE